MIAVANEGEDETAGVLFDAETFKRLRAIMTRLYDDRPLTGDERRDLANRMHAILGQALPVKAREP